MRQDETAQIEALKTLAPDQGANRNSRDTFDLVSLSLNLIPRRVAIPGRGAQTALSQFILLDL